MRPQTIFGVELSPAGVRDAAEYAGVSFVSAGALVWHDPEAPAAPTEDGLWSQADLQQGRAYRFPRSASRLDGLTASFDNLGTAR